jgi:hypothetical protein
MFGHLPGAGMTPENDTSTPNGGSVNIDSIGTTNFNFLVPFTESQRHILFANNSYHVEQWLKEYMAPRSATNPNGGNPYSDTASYANIPQPQPMMSAKTMAFFNNKAVWPYVSMKDNYDDANPGFLIPPTNYTGIKSFLFRKWTDNSDTTWAFDPNADINQRWPLNEQMRYSNATLRAAGMGGFPLGDLSRWWRNIPSTYTDWRAQQAAEDQTINDWLTNGVTAVGDEANGTPLEYELSQNYPNPFNPSTEISYVVPQKSEVTLKVFNTLGMEVATLHAGVQDAGQHTATFDAAGLSSGIYFYRLQAGSVSITRKMVFMK